MTAVATTVAGGSAASSPACVLALSTIEVGVFFGGNTDLILDECSIASNSPADPSIQQVGTSDVTADCVYAAGPINNSGNSNMTTTGCETPVTIPEPFPDPYADLELPDDIPDCVDFEGTLSPNTSYCAVDDEETVDIIEDTIVVNNDQVLDPGVYYFEDNVTLHSNLVGEGVTFVTLTESSLHINAGAQLVLSAPTTGDFAGILFYQNREVSGSTHFINGHSANQLTGAMYFPTADVTVNGTADATDGCLQLIAFTLHFIGTSNFSHNCGEDSGVTPILPGSGGGTRIVLVD